MAIFCFWGTRPSFISKTTQMNIIDQTDEEILSVADPMWLDLIRNSNDGNYAEFTKDFSKQFALALNEIEAGNQFANSQLTKSLSDDVDCLGLIRRGEHVTVLYRQRSTARPGEWLGRLVLGYEDGEVRIFGASIF